MIPDDPVRQLTDRYDREAVPYRDLWAPILKAASSRLLQEIPTPEIRRVLDLGSGVGALIPDIAKRFPGARILGVDRAQGMLRLSVHGYPRAVMDATQLAIPTHSVDLVIIAFVLFHVSDPEQALSEIRRVLRPGGLVGCITWGQELESPAFRIWTECLDAHGAAEIDPSAAAQHDRFNTSEKLKRLFEDGGFSSVRSWEEERVPMIEREHLLSLRTQMGSSKPRFDSLSPENQRACLAEATRRMDRLSSENFVARGRTVHTVASA
ncbi:MAG: class I SAM-dependent methyltransferase [Candidatus Eisenbacteria bacterium]|nr:class I SAM-dependent methyltransferase [Candidatus Eisenbacteria bacterium]